MNLSGTYCRLFHFFLISILLLPSIQDSYSESVVDTLDEDPREGGHKLLTEKIEKISLTRRLFILTNKNDHLAPGDFFSILLDENLVARALVAKKSSEQLGTKIVKIYSLKHWEQLYPSKEVQILKGDDSYFVKKAEKDGKPEEEDGSDSKKSGKDGALSESELLDDLDDGTIDDKGKRGIKTDNVISLNYGRISVQHDDTSEQFDHLSAKWAYQVFDDTWGEATLGRSTLSKFPSDNLDTTMTTISITGKYTFEGPIYSYIQPYIGYQMNKTEGDAGVQNSEGTLSEAQLQEESEIIDQVEKNSVIYGVTILKRLVPGWFMRFDLGFRMFQELDGMSLGFSFEF